MKGFEAVFSFLVHALLDNFDDDNKLTLFEMLLSSVDVTFLCECMKLCDSVGCFRAKEIVRNRLHHILGMEKTKIK